MDRRHRIQLVIKGGYQSTCVAGQPNSRRPAGINVPAGTLALVRSPLALRCSREQNALHTLIHQRHLTPSCGGQVPTAERTLDPARMLRESLNPGPELENNQGQKHVLPHCNSDAWFSPIVYEMPRPSLAACFAGAMVPRPLLSEGSPGRRRERRTERGRLQSPPGPRVAEGFFAPHPRHALTGLDAAAVAQIALLTVDYLCRRRC
jgi:hypothetical protein